MAVMAVRLQDPGEIGVPSCWPGGPYIPTDSASQPLPATRGSHSCQGSWRRAKKLHPLKVKIF